MPLNSLCQKKKKYVNIQSVIKMKKTTGPHGLPQNGQIDLTYRSYKILINIVSSYFELSRASLFN